MFSSNPFPPSAELRMNFAEKSVFRIPVVLALSLMERDRVDRDVYERLTYWGDKDFALGPSINGVTESDCLSHFKNEIKWVNLQPYIHADEMVIHTFHCLWEQPEHKMEIQFRCEPIICSLNIAPISYPSHLYRYLSCDTNRINSILRGNLLHFSCPGRFNDPFDCGIDENMRLLINDNAMLCFCESKDDVLLYSHYADGHRGLCLIFDPKRLVETIQQENIINQVNVSCSIRPIWYAPRIPPIDFSKCLALLCTFKASNWAYEKEWRAFLDVKNQLLQEGDYKFGPSALKGIIFGCRMDEKKIIEVKEMVAQRNDLSLYIAKRVPENLILDIAQI